MSLCSLIFLSTLTMSVGVHANTCLYCLSRSMSTCLVHPGRLQPMLTGWSGYSSLITSFSFVFSTRAFLVSLVISVGCMTVKNCNSFGSVVRTVAGPSVVLNFMIPCIVDGIAPSLSRAVLRRMMLCSAQCRIMTKSIKIVFHRCFSWLVSVRGKWIVLSGHRMCPMEPTNLPVMGLRLSFHPSGRRRKQCS